MENTIQDVSLASASNENVHEEINGTILQDVSEQEILNNKVTLIESLSKLKKQNKLYLNEIEELKDQIEETWEYTEALERDLTNLCQYNRRESIEIVGIPESIPNHALEETVVGILRLECKGYNIMIL